MQIINPSAPVKYVELTLLFVILPLVLAFNPLLGLSLGLVACALLYVLWISKAMWGKNRWRNLPSAIRAGFSFRATTGKKVIGRFAIMFGLFIIGSSAFVYFNRPDDLFHVIINNGLLWFAISIFYSVFSVLPQEFLYRTFFIERYNSLFPNHALMIVVNAVVFCLAHVMFFNQLVLILTFCGGLLFSYTYLKTRSFLIVSIEHCFYGVWLYTVGMGAMLAFPSGT